MCWPGKAIDATMLAAAIGIDRPVEADIWRIVARDHLSRGVERHGGLERRQLLQTLPAVIEGRARLGLVAAADVGLRAAPAPPLPVDCNCKFGKRRKRTRRLGGRRDRRVLEGMRGCSTHGINIATRREQIKNNSV